MTHGIFVGHHDRTGIILCFVRNWIVRGKSCAVNWDGLWQTVTIEMTLSKKVTADKAVAGPPLPRIVFDRITEIESRRFYVLSADNEAHEHTGGCLACAAVTSHGRAITPHNNECRERIRTIIERTLTGWARMNACKDRVPETEERKEWARMERSEECLHGTWERGIDGGSTCGRIWRRRGSTRRELNERDSPW